MKKWITLAALLMLGGCASKACTNAEVGSPCRTDRLLYNNDMLQAKLLIVAGDPQNNELTQALLKRASNGDATGEAPFYEAVVMIRENADLSATLKVLDKAAKQNHPLAITLLSKLYSENPDIRDAAKAQQYRETYSHLDVAKSGYPSFEKALSVVNSLLAPRQAETAQLQP